MRLECSLICNTVWSPNHYLALLSRGRILNAGRLYDYGFNVLLSDICFPRIRTCTLTYTASSAQRFTSSLINFTVNCTPLLYSLLCRAHYYSFKTLCSSMVGRQNTTTTFLHENGVIRNPRGLPWSPVIVCVVAVVVFVDENTSNHHHSILPRSQNPPA